MGVLELLILLVALGVGILASIFWIWMLIDCATKESDEGNEKIVWVIIIVVTGIIGAALYYFVRRPSRIAELGE